MIDVCQDFDSLDEDDADISKTCKQCRESMGVYISYLWMRSLQTVHNSWKSTAQSCYKKS